MNWRNAAATQRCAESVIAALEADRGEARSWRLLVVDNGSGPGEADTLREWQAGLDRPQLELVLNQRNLGFAAGMNAGIARLQAEPADYVWLLNNDTEVAPGAITALLDFSSSHPEAAIVGATILDPDTGLIKAAGGCGYNRWLGYSRPVGEGMNVSRIADIDEGKIDYIDGAALWLRGDFLTRVGGLPDDQFLYGEELELNARLAPGEQFRWCRGARVAHVGGASTTSARLQARATYHAALSIFDYTGRHYPWCLPSVMTARLGGISARAMWRRQPDLIPAVLRAIRDHFSPGRAGDS